MNKPILCFFTNSYPYGNGETFIENELSIIAPFFDVIYLFHKSSASERRAIPSNVKLIYIEPFTSPAKSRSIGDVLMLINLLVNELLFSRQKKMFLKNLRYNMAYALNGIYYANQIKLCLDSAILKNAFFYSYWFFDWNLSLSILKRNDAVTQNYTRAHGFDIYEDNGKPNYLPFRKFCLNNTDMVFTVSEVGANYLKSIYPEFETRISCSYLGTQDAGVNPQPSLDLPIHIVSCSNIVSVKRLHLIVEILKHCQKKIIWTHIGDGNLKNDILLRVKSLASNCTVKFTGQLCASRIVEFYTQTPIDVFINCSISEGLPVSIMEAISFGIPVIATDVGGTKEIIIPTTGYLIDKVVDVKKTAALIQGFRENCMFKRQDIKIFWKNNFSAKENYIQFCKTNFSKN